jgi:hypothetical protein
MNAAKENVTMQLDIPPDVQPLIDKRCFER